MNTSIDIRFNVSPADKETIELRADENGFDDIASYVKVVALKADTFVCNPTGATDQESAVEISFKVSPTQKTKLDDKMKEAGAETLTDYLCYVALHAVVGAVVEIRSTGSFDAMVARIMAAKKK
ncbi:MAG: hypothetical protein GQ531_00220 [Sulfurovum sp.]|nr:hypothetical protein [Sulfurovum sp.]